MQKAEESYHLGFTDGLKCSTDIIDSKTVWAIFDQGKLLGLFVSRQQAERAIPRILVQQSDNEGAGSVSFSFGVRQIPINACYPGGYQL